MVDSSGQVKTSQQDIVDVFADLYADLYASKSPYTFDEKIFCSATQILDITAGEVEVQLKNMRKNKAGDGVGLVATNETNNCRCIYSNPTL